MTIARYVAHNGSRHEIYTTPSGKLRIIQNPRPRNGRAYFRDITAEEAATFEAWDAYKARRDSGKAKSPRGTCQICGREIGVAAGVIAHHGYERPQHGWQTSSCSGARHLPYEKDRTQLGEHIDWLRLTLKAQTLRRDTVRSEEFAEDLIGRRSNRLGDTFTVKKGDRLWDTLRHEMLCRLTSEIEIMPKEIERQQARYDAWKAPA